MLKGIKDVQRAIAQKDVSVSDLCNIAYDIINSNQKLNAFITTRSRQDALEEAYTLEDRSPDNPLYGIPISIKDNFCTKGLLTTCGSKMLHNFVPPYDATVVSKLKQAKCIITGKTNMDEFAMGSSSTTSYYNPTLNYWNAADDTNSSDWFMAGGSSTGCAVSVADGSCYASIGTDTGGSTRQPASLTGTVGLKPTYGLISRFGLIPLVNNLDVVGLITRSVYDAELVFNQLAGHDENDLTTVDHTKELKSKVHINTDQTIRIGIPEKFISRGDLAEDVSKQFAKILDVVSGGHILGCNFELVTVDLPNSNLATECYTVLSSAEIASNMSCYDGVKYGLSIKMDRYDREELFKCNRDSGFGDEVKKRILLGNYFLLEHNIERYVSQAQRVRRLISDDFRSVFEQYGCHAILMPSTPTTSITHSEWLSKQDGNKLFHEDYYLIPANLANVPSMSLPCGFSHSSGLPIGMQLITNKFHDLDLFKIGKKFEQIFSEIK